MNYSFYDELDELDDIIAESSDDEIFIETMEEDLGLNDPRYGVFEEKKTHEQYALEKFKKKYKYNASNNTIEVDGKRYKVDINIHDDYIHVLGKDGKHKWRFRNTGVDLNDKSKITLDRDFFNLKNGKRREAALQHEIGHAKLHATDTDSEYVDKSKLSIGVLKRKYLLKAKQYYNDAIKQGKSKEEANRISQELYKALIKNNPEVERYKDGIRSNMSKADRTEREDTFNHALSKSQKYRRTINNPHINPTELEADRYAANKTDERTVKRGLREVAKRKSTDKAIDKLTRGEHMSKMLTNANIDPDKKYGTLENPGPKPKNLKDRLNKAENELRSNPYDSDARRSLAAVNRERINDPNTKNASEKKELYKFTRKVADHEVKSRSDALKDEKLRNSKSLK